MTAWDQDGCTVAVRPTGGYEKVLVPSLHRELEPVVPEPVGRVGILASYLLDSWRLQAQPFLAIHHHIWTGAQRPLELLRIVDSDADRVGPDSPEQPDAYQDKDRARIGIYTLDDANLDMEIDDSEDEDEEEE